MIRDSGFSYAMGCEWAFSVLPQGRADRRRTFRDFALTGDEEAKRVLVDAADSLVELYTPQVSLCLEV